jgi:uncharacterized protein (TIGR02996 family)
MSRQQSLLHAILDDPEDDAVRLVYADWLEEYDDTDRAEFIRVQVALHARAEPEKEDLKRREKDLWTRHGTRWMRELPAWARSGVTYERGFAWLVTATLAQILQGAKALWRRAPVQALNLYVGRNKASERLDEFALVPFLTRVTSLSLVWNQLSPVEVATLLSSPHLGGLRSLWLGGNQEGDVLARLVAGEPARLAALRLLDLGNTMIGDAGVSVLAAAPWKQLQVLDLRGNPIGTRGFLALARSESLGALTMLRLRSTPAVSLPAREALQQRFGKALQFG